MFFNRILFKQNVLAYYYGTVTQKYMMYELIPLGYLQLFYARIIRVDSDKLEYKLQNH